LVMTHAPPGTAKERSRNTVWPILNLCTVPPYEETQRSNQYRFWVVSAVKKRLAKRRALKGTHCEPEHCPPKPQRRQGCEGPGLRPQQKDEGMKPWRLRPSS
jgi:hypothetical protein